MRKAVTVISSLALGLLMNAASAAGVPDWLHQPLKKPLDKVVIGVTQNNAGVDSYETTYEQTMRNYAKELGIQIILLDPQGDPARQTNQIQDMIAQHVDVMVVWPTNAKAVVPAVWRAHRAGIPVVITNSKIDPSGQKYTVSFSGPNTYKEGEVAAGLMAEALNGKGQVVEITGVPGYTTAVLRKKGFDDVIKKKYPGIHIMDSQPANWNRAKAQSVMEDFLTKYGDKIDGVYAEDDNMGAGALNAIKAKGLAGKIKLVGATNFAVGYDAIKNGTYYGSVVQSPEDDARNALKVAVQVAEGQKVPKLDYINTPPISQKNIDKFPRPSF